jgi:hypothetical protein
LDLCNAWLFATGHDLLSFIFEVCALEECRAVGDCICWRKQMGLHLASLIGLWCENGSKKKCRRKNLIPCGLLVQTFNGIDPVFAASEPLEANLPTQIMANEPVRMEAAHLNSKAFISTVKRMPQGSRRLHFSFFSRYAWCFPMVCPSANACARWS